MNGSCKSENENSKDIQGSNFFYLNLDEDFFSFYLGCLGKTHIKKIVFLVVGPLRWGVKPPEPLRKKKLFSHSFQVQGGRGYSDLSGQIPKKAIFLFAFPLP